MGSRVPEAQNYYLRINHTIITLLTKLFQPANSSQPRNTSDSRRFQV